MPKVTPLGQPGAGIAPQSVTVKATTMPKVFTAPAPAPVADATPAPETPAATPDVSANEDAKRFAALSRREKQQRERDLALKAKEAEIARREEAFSSKDILSIASQLGMTADDVAAQILKQQPGNETDQRYQKLETKLTEMEKAQKAAEESRTQAQKQQYDQALARIKTEAVELGADERFAAIKASDLFDDVVSRIEENFKATGEVMSTEEAMTAMEQELVDTAVALAKLPKVAALLAPAPPKEEPAPTKPEIPVATTLTHKATATAKPGLSKQELRQRMIDRLNGLVS